MLVSVCIATAALISRVWMRLIRAWISRDGMLLSDERSKSGDRDLDADSSAESDEELR